MKRCPQCDFVYEDEQSLCDMDGCKLDFDSRPLPKLQALTVMPAANRKSLWQGRTTPAMATLVLVIVLGLVYYVSTHRQFPSQRQPAASSVQTQPIGSVPTRQVHNDGMNTVPVTSDTAETKNEEPTAKPAGAEKNDVDSDAKPSERSQGRAAEGAKKPVTVKSKPGLLQVAQPATTPRAASEKKDSKVGELLKKTGRLLKKPFKL